MSDKAPLYDVTKVHIKADIKAATKVKLDKIRAEAGLSISEMVSAILDRHTAKVPFTEEDQRKVDEIVNGNIEKRRALKAKKGIR